MDSANLRRAMLASLRSYWQQAAGYQKLAYTVGVLLVLSAGFHAAVLLLTGGSLEGDTSWRKPILFGESFGLTTIFLAWVMTFLALRAGLGWLLSVTLTFMYTYEVAWVSFQQWRGVSSHFNSNTALDQTLFDLAGFAIGFSGLVILALTVLAFTHLRAPASLAWAIRAGLLLLVAGQVFGLAMITRGGHTIGAAGTMKLPHALSIHALQVLPLLAWLLLFSDKTERQRTQLVLLGATGYSLLVIVFAYQAYSGLAPLELGLLPVLGIVLGLVALAAAFLGVLLALRHPSPQESGSPASA